MIRSRHWEPGEEDEETGFPKNPNEPIGQGCNQVGTKALIVRGVRARLTSEDDSEEDSKQVEIV